MKVFSLVFVVAAGLVALAPSAGADVRLPGFFNDHMVLQRDAPITVWGWANPGEIVRIAFGDTELTTNADQEGKWRVDLPAMEAGGPHTLSVSSANVLTIDDVWIGEVWLCSGQSNMEWRVDQSLNQAEEIAAATDSLIRQVKIPHIIADTPRDDVSANWVVCSPETAGAFTAAGYFMARHLREALDVPIGLVNASWGGSRIEPWTPIEGFHHVPSLAGIRDQVAGTLPGSPEYVEGIRRHMEETEAWLALARQALAESVRVPESPSFPDSLKPLQDFTSPTGMYNGMIHPLVGYGMRGAIWYQGEANRHDGMAYLAKKRALVGSWRAAWDIGQFPFYFVQIAPFRYGGRENEEDPHILPAFWEAQQACSTIPNTGMVVTNDIGDLDDIHPKNKQEVGRRLALLALKHTYGQSDLVAEGPRFDALVPEGEHLRVRFSNTGGGLRARDGQALTWFEIIGDGPAFVPATAEIDGDDVLLSSPKVPAPVAMRFAWDQKAEPNLVNGAGLPPSAFRAGEVPEYDYLSKHVPEAADYETVYDLDLKALDADDLKAAGRSGAFPSRFDRVAYFLELTPNGQEEAQFVFVSLEPFTNDVTKIGLPTAASGARFQKSVRIHRIRSNVDGLSTEEPVDGNLEFWPHNYGATNGAEVPGASSETYDFGDEPSEPQDGYGSMQVHHTEAGKTIFSVNRWNGGDQMDLGIGNRPEGNPDWTFAGNGGSFKSARLRVLVKRGSN